MRKKTTLKPEKKLFPDIKELWEYRDLFWVLAHRDYRVRYAQTILGFLWAFLQPVVSALIFVIVFGKFVGVKTDLPYPVFVMSGMTVWTFFSYVMSQAGSSLIASQQMVKKIFFPRLVIPLSKAVVGLIDFILAFLVFIAVTVYYDVEFRFSVIFLPLVIILVIFSSLGVGIWFSALSIRYRDFQHVLPFFVQIGLYAAPIAYGSEVVTDNLPSWANYLYFLNPTIAPIEIIRWMFFGIGEINELILLSIVSSIFIFVSSLFFFKRVEYLIADLI